METLLEKSNRVAKDAAELIGGTFEQGVGFKKATSGSVPDVKTTPKVTPSAQIDTNALETPSLSVSPDASSSDLLNQILSTAQDESFNVDTMSQVTPLQNRILGLNRELEGQEAFTQSKEEEFNVPVLNESFRDLTNTIRNKQASLRQGLLDEEGRVIPMEFITGRQAEMGRQAAIEIESLAAAAEAVNNNLISAESRVKNAVDLKYNPILARIDTSLQALQFIRDNATDERATRAEQRANVLEALKLQYEDAKADETEARSLVLTAIENGADPQTAAQLLQQPDLSFEDVTNNLGGFLSEDGITSGLSEPVDQAMNVALNSLEFGSVSAAESAKATLQSLITSGNREQAKEFLFTQIRNSASATQQDVLDGKQSSILALERIRERLEEFEAAGGDTGIFTGLRERGLNRIGRTLDPELAEIANDIAISIIDYRKAVSGAAFTESEGAEYDAIFPSAGKTPELNEALINSLINKFESDIKQFAKQRIGETNYERIFAPTYTNLVEYVKENPEQIDEIEKVKENFPNLSDLEILEVITGVPMSFSTVGGDTQAASIKIPKSSRLSFVNNNPGNLKFVGQPGAVAGEGGFAKFPTPQAGYKALKDQIKLDAQRGDTLATFISQYAPPSENDTELYIEQMEQRLGVSRDTPISEIDLNALARAVALKESSTRIT